MLSPDQLPGPPTRIPGMPTYEYVCSKCDQHLEVYQSFSEEPLKRHSGCGGKLSKVFGSIGIVLKGSGFYRNDNASASRRSAERSESSGSSDSSKSSDSKSSGSKSDSGKSESKPAAKTDKKTDTKKSA
jgi:putative FmdB family regulatory protein